LKRAILLALLASGCTYQSKFPYAKLIDQRSFQPGGVFGGPAIAGLAPKPEQVKDLPPMPLVIIRFASPDQDFSPEIASAVDAAQSRKPDVEFNVVAIVPGGATPDTPVQDAQAVARAIAQESVQEDHIHMSLLDDAKATGREVRIYVR